MLIEPAGRLIPLKNRLLGPGTAPFTGEGEKSLKEAGSDTVSTVFWSNADIFKTETGFPGKGRERSFRWKDQEIRPPAPLPWAMIGSRLRSDRRGRGHGMPQFFIFCQLADQGVALRIFVLGFLVFKQVSGFWSRS